MITHGGILTAFCKAKEAILNIYILYDSTYMIFWKKQNYEDSKKVSGCQWLGRKGMNISC